MNQAYDEIQRNIPKLSVKEKASLAYELLRELDGEPDEDAAELWLEESEVRLDGYLNGEIEAIDGDQAIAEICGRLK